MAINQKTSSIIPLLSEEIITRGPNYGKNKKKRTVASMTPKTAAGVLSGAPPGGASRGISINWIVSLCPALLCTDSVMLLHRILKNIKHVTRKARHRDSLKGNDYHARL